MDEVMCVSRRTGVPEETSHARRLKKAVVWPARWSIDVLFELFGRCVFPISPETTAIALQGDGPPPL